MMNKLPFLPLTAESSKKYSRGFKPMAGKLLKLKPSLISELAQLEAGITPVEYIAAAFLSFFYAFFFLLLFLEIAIIAFLPGELYTSLAVVLASCFVFSVFIFVQFLYYPRLLLKRKASELNRDLLFALRHLLIQIRSGVPLYNAMVSVSEANYGVVSDEFGRTSKEISGGISQTDALDNMVMRTPSIYLRRAIWQVSNAIRAGSDLADVIELLVKEFSEEEKVNLQRFSKELSPWALMYLMLTVVFPTMGIAMLLVLTTLTPIVISNTLFVIMLVFFAIFQFFFLKFLKNKRPMVRF